MFSVANANANANTIANANANANGDCVVVQFKCSLPNCPMYLILRRMQSRCLGRCLNFH